MIIGLKDVIKLFGISIIACCAVFVCALFLNYNIDLHTIENKILTEIGMNIYQAQVSMGKVISVVSGGCLILTSVVMVLFYIKNYIDSHGKELGILKALGYSDFKVAKSFWVFGISAMVGCLLGYFMASLYMPTFYTLQNAESLLPVIEPSFHLYLTLFLIILPTLFFVFLSIGYAYRKLNRPVLDLLTQKEESKYKENKKENQNLSFLQELKSMTLRSKKSLVFLVIFSTFCFSSMTQMSMSLDQVASESFAYMVMAIGLILASVTMILSLSSVVKANIKTIAMMRVLGYKEKDCSHAVLGGYRPLSYIGFIIGTIYQYLLMKVVLYLLFSDIDSILEYNFNYKGLVLSLISFILIYEFIMYYYSHKIKKVSIKAIMLE